MKRFGAFALVAVMIALGGCAVPARYIEKKDNSGVVAVPDESNTWPNYNKRAALELIEKHVGPNYEIVQEGPVTTTRTVRNALPETNEALNPRNQAYPAKRPIGAAPTTTQDVTEYRITYKKVDGTSRPSPFVSDINHKGTTVGLTPAGGTTSQTQYPPAGAVAPGAQPAGGPISVFNRGTVQPAGGADCDH